MSMHTNTVAMQEKYAWNPIIITKHIIICTDLQQSSHLRSIQNIFYPLCQFFFRNARILKNVAKNWRMGEWQIKLIKDKGI